MYIKLTHNLNLNSCIKLQNKIGAHSFAKNKHGQRFAFWKITQIAHNVCTNIITQLCCQC